jgi:coproporphyrinogen III oxidase-like Fe-S oxidoreductase
VCPYCDFAVTTGAPEHERYLDAVVAELAARAPRFSGELVSIYFGGGTPSLWEPACIARAIAAIRATFGGAPREITLEANPIDCTQSNCARWKSAGVTRVSIGVQSVAADELVVLGRDHRFGDGPAALAGAVAVGFATSCDLIMGTPTGRVPDLRSVDALAATAVDHLSVYELTIEDRTAFGARVRDGRLIPLADDVLAELYEAVDARLAAAGFEHYEISSYARPGKRAVHNSLYWTCTPFLGLGVGAASLEVLADGSGVRATSCAPSGRGSACARGMASPKPSCRATSCAGSSTSGSRRAKVGGSARACEGFCSPIGSRHGSPRRCKLATTDHGRRRPVETRAEDPARGNHRISVRR